MIDQPVLETARLRLRPLERSDASAIQQAASARQIADTMISLPHPYPAGEAERFIARQQAEREAGRAVTFAVTQKVGGGLCGLVDVREIDREHSQAELSFWLAVGAWGQGYMSEGVGAVVRYALDDLGLNRLYAYHMLRNPASGRVLEKNGWTQEGLLRERVRKWGRFEDVALWAILGQDQQDANDRGASPLFIRSNRSPAMVRSRQTPAKRQSMRPRVKIWLEMDDQYVFGFGISEILKAVQQSGSIKAAAELLGKSYRHVWNRIKKAEEALGEPLVDTRVGGKTAGRSALTELACQLVSSYDALRQRMFEVVEDDFSSRFDRVLNPRRTR